MSMTPEAAFPGRKPKYAPKPYASSAVPEIRPIVPNDTWEIGSQSS